MFLSASQKPISLSDTEVLSETPNLTRRSRGSQLFEFSDSSYSSDSAKPMESIFGDSQDLAETFSTLSPDSEKWNFDPDKVTEVTEVPSTTKSLSMTEKTSAKAVNTNNVTKSSKFAEKVKEKGLKLEKIFDQTKDKLKILDQLETSQWLLGLHQALLFVLVLARWFIPRAASTE